MKIFGTHPSDDAAPVEVRQTAEVVFITGGLKAAFHTQGDVREGVLVDISAALNCEPQDLDFLFSASSSQDTDTAIFDFPDSERRRRVIRNNYPRAAE